jgi:hypothetical protein
METSAFRAIRFDTLAADALKVTISHPTSALNTVDVRLNEKLTGNGKSFGAGGDFVQPPALGDLTALTHLRRDAKRLVRDFLDVALPAVCTVNKLFCKGR